MQYEAFGEVLQCYGIAVLYDGAGGYLTGAAYGIAINSMVVDDKKDGRLP